METLYIVVPCYNDGDVLPLTAPLFGDKLVSLIDRGLVSDSSRVVFVDDGSADDTWSVISSFCDSEPDRFTGIKLARNSGQQAALLAGLFTVRDMCDITVTMDSDMQDDPDVIDLMLQRRAEGCDIVYGVRNDRSVDPFFKRFCSTAFYRLMRRLDPGTVLNEADCRMMSREAIGRLERFPESDIYLPGVIPRTGCKSAEVYFKRRERMAGKPSYTFSKLVKLALDAITSASSLPLRLISVAGPIFAVPAFVCAVWAVVDWCVASADARLLTVVALILISTSAVLLGMGVMAEYVARIFTEVKRRPRYIIDEIKGAPLPPGDGGEPVE